MVIIPKARIKTNYNQKCTTIETIRRLKLLGAGHHSVAICCAHPGSQNRMAVDSTKQRLHREPAWMPIMSPVVTVDLLLAVYIPLARKFLLCLCDSNRCRSAPVVRHRPPLFVAFLAVRHTCDVTSESAVGSRHQETRMLFFTSDC